MNTIKELSVPLILSLRTKQKYHKASFNLPSQFLPKKENKCNDFVSCPKLCVSVCVSVCTHLCAFGSSKYQGINPFASNHYLNPSLTDLSAIGSSFGKGQRTFMESAHVIVLAKDFTSICFHASLHLYSVLAF